MSNLFGGSSAPAAPTPTPPPTMPDPNGPEQREAARKAALTASQRSGRNSTILSNPSNRASSTIAGGSYGSTKLGAG